MERAADRNAAEQRDGIIGQLASYYSLCNASAGDIREALTAGIAAAMSTTALTMHAVPESTDQSDGDTPKSSVFII